MVERYGYGRLYVRDLSDVLQETVEFCGEAGIIFYLVRGDDLPRAVSLSMPTGYI